ncbi:MAG: hypothetical protein WBW47_03145 [Thermoplasmata archaeon]
MLKENGIETASKTYPRWQYEVAGIGLILAALGITVSLVSNVLSAYNGTDGPYGWYLIVAFVVVAGLLVFVGVRLLRRDHGP